MEPKVAECKERMHKAVVHLQEEFSAVRTGRATPALVDKLKVDYYGTEVPLQQIAGFSVPEPRVLVISPYDKGAIKGIEKAIQGSDLGVNPSNDGTVRRDIRKELETQERDGELSRDELDRIEKDLEKVTHEAIAEIDSMLVHKERELLEV
jgi:ribosome recycling factor